MIVSSNSRRERNVLYKITNNKLVLKLTAEQEMASNICVLILTVTKEWKL